MKEKLESVWEKVSSPDFQEHSDLERSFRGHAGRGQSSSLGSAAGFALSRAGEDGASIIRIPVCYEPEYGPDLDLLAGKKGLTREEVIRLHTADIYRVYMIGFLPGFPYLGKVAPALEIPRKERPVPVVAGGVGIAGNQTGIYPLHSPGGWQIIGRTPLKLFDPCAPVPVSMKVGDWVQFFSITQQEFRDFAARST
jgi:inhibitor of KinA